MQVTEVTRRNIADALTQERFGWSGRLEEPNFLSRIFDLTKLPSTDHRFKDAYGDIWQHRVNNYDWSGDWVFYDARFNLLYCDDEVFLRFLCEMLHPVVQSDPEEVERIRQLVNQLLRVDGFEIVERTRLSDRPVFVARQTELGELSTVYPLREEFSGANYDYVLRQITRMEAAINEDPDLAIGTAKELVETCCKTILKERSVEIQGSPDLPQLVKLAAQELKLIPDDVLDQAAGAKTIKRLLSNLATISQGIAELRNQYGTGHGKEASTKGLRSRHARLAVGTASTLAIFLMETHREK